MWDDRSFYYQPVYVGMRFSEVEKHQIMVSVLVLTVAFALALSGGIFHMLEIGFKSLIILLVISFIIVVTGFLLHELAHKYVAQRFGCWAEYRYFRQGLLIALFISIFGVIFAAPGAVYISGMVGREENGKISVAGPLTNVSIAVLFLIPYSLVTAGNFGNLPGIDYNAVISVSTIIGAIAFYGFWINLILAGFNMIPIPPFDGSKVVNWSAPIFVFVFMLIIGLGMLVMGAW